MVTVDDRPFVWPELKADCARCTGLCCAAYPFIDLQRFAYEKPADQACRHLGADCRCAIHADREAVGFSGCITFDCNGAGQRVAGEVFASVDWRFEPVAAREIFDAFRTLTRIHSALLQMKLLEDLPFDERQRDDYRGLFLWLEPAEGWTVENLSEFPAHTAEKKVQDFATSLGGSEAGRALIARLK